MFEMKEMLIWLYGKSARNAHIRLMAEKTINLLAKKPMEYQELCSILGISLNQYQKPKRTFYFVVNPLKKVQLIKEKREYISQDTKKYKTIYFLSPDTFHGYMRKTLDDFHSSIKSLGE
ncbi:MAG: hypothetical protein HY362_01205 [Candidatus Aenigmarchaeota archaeon]|nr:hypothetical protein [Candidatus Aenigmarchaeota archaeon]